MTVQIGQENAALMDRIDRSLISGHISHAYLVEGPSYLDKPAFARELAKGILCPGHRGLSAIGCGECPVCDKVDHDNHEDLIYVRRTGKSSVGIEAIRDMQKQVAVKPNGDRYVVIIEEGDLVTEDAQNCLLKTLEEPPGAAVLILLSDNSEHLLPTIRSRCVRYRVEGSGRMRDGRLSGLGAGLADMVLEGEPFYRCRKALGKAAKDRDSTRMIIDCMEERCRERILERNDKGVLSSPGEISAFVQALEEARSQLDRGMTPSYVMKRMLLALKK